MLHGDVLLNNVLAIRGKRLDRRKLRELLVVAAQDGVLDAVERAWLEALPWPADCRAELNAYLRRCEGGEAPNPEVEAMRLRDPRFDQRVAALVTHARPGDIIGWSSDQPGLPWSLMRAAYGPWMHVSVVLDDGLLIDPYWPEGLTLSTPASAIAKSFTRIKASEFVITRPEPALTPEQITALCQAGRAELGRPYAFVARLDKPSVQVSCSRAAWELYKAQGVDLATDESRMYRTAIAPADMVCRPIAHVYVDGRVELDPAPVPAPQGTIASLVHLLDDAMADMLPFQDFMYRFKAPVTWLFMTAMAKMGRETRPGFLRAADVSWPDRAVSANIERPA
jgi:hypothetical protein